MEARAETERAACPLLMPGAWGLRGLAAASIYCRLPGGRVRVPPREDVARFCAPRRFEACPTYERSCGRPAVP